MTTSVTNEFEWGGGTQHKIALLKFTLEFITDSESLPKHCAQGKQRVNWQKTEHWTSWSEGIWESFKKPAACCSVCRLMTTDTHATQNNAAFTADYTATGGSASRREVETGMTGAPWGEKDQDTDRKREREGLGQRPVDECWSCCGCVVIISFLLVLRLITRQTVQRGSDRQKQRQGASLEKGIGI